MLGLERDDAEAFVAAGFAPRRPSAGAGQEAGHRLRKVPQRLLLHHLRTMTEPITPGSGLRELSALLQVAWRAWPSGTPMRLLLDCEVPYKRACAQWFRNAAA
jgi:hypothetical protein